MLNIKRVLSEEDAVSPVIGVILMVAITVILAAVIGAFVLGLGDSVQQTAPQTSFTFDYSQSGNDTLVITHDGGDTIDAARLNVSVSGAIANGSSATYSDSSGAFGSSGDVGAGTSYELNESTFTPTATSSDQLDLTGATVRVVWTSVSGDDSATLAKWEGPSA